MAGGAGPTLTAAAEAMLAAGMSDLRAFDVLESIVGAVREEYGD